MSRPKVEVLAGINLPMLVKLDKGPGRSSAVRGGRRGAESGRKNITIAAGCWPEMTNRAPERGCPDEPRHPRPTPSPRDALSREGAARPRLGQSPSRPGKSTPGAGQPVRREPWAALESMGLMPGAGARHRINVEATGKERRPSSRPSDALIRRRFGEEE